MLLTNHNTRPYILNMSKTNFFVNVKKKQQQHDMHADS